MPKTMVVLPTYNEADNLPLMIPALLALPIDQLSILIVDDNSPDGTGALADQLAAQHPDRIQVMHRAQKQGLGPAYIAGFKYALKEGADFIVQMDCDFSHQPHYLPEMIAAAEHSDVVIGSRYARGGKVDESWGWFRKALSGFANRLYIPLVLSIPVQDATGGFRVWRRQTLIGIDLDRIGSNGYIFQVETTYIACRLGFTIKEIPIYFPDRQVGDSKLDYRIQREAAIRVWQIKFAHRALTPAMRRTTTYN